MATRTVTGTVEAVGEAIDLAGVLVLVAGLVVATGVFVVDLRRAGFAPAYRGYRRGLGRAILLGLELFIAGDIIRTVAIEPTLERVAVLAGIVLIRILLSVTLQSELEGRWPWQTTQREEPIER